MSASIFARPAKLPSLIIWRCGQVWLPIGNPSGLARTVTAPAAKRPPMAASAAACRRKSRLESAAMTDLSSMLIARLKPSPRLSRQRERVQRITGADDDKLPAVEHERDRRVRRRRVKPGVPQRIAGRWIVSD